MSATNANPVASCVLLNLGRRRFALPSTNIAELAPPVRLHTFPHKTLLISGVIVRRNRIIPVYDLASILINRPGMTGRFYLITEQSVTNAVSNSGKPEAQEFCAIPVSGGCELKTIEILPPAPGSAAYVQGVVIAEDEPIEVLNLNALLASAQSRDQTDGSGATQ